MTSPPAPDATAAAAGWLAEAVESGNPLAPLPAAMAPADTSAGEEIAFAVLEQLSLPPCGLRLVPGPAGEAVIGPLVEARLLRDGAKVALAALPHALAAPAIAGLLAAPLDPDSDAPPVFASLHAALDLGSSRFSQGPADAAAQAADLGGLGLLLLGRARPVPAAALLPVALRRPGGKRVRAVPVAAVAALERVAAAARRLGGLPAGALLVAVLTPGEVPAAGEELVADLGPLGRVSGHCA